MFNPDPRRPGRTYSPHVVQGDRQVWRWVLLYGVGYNTPPAEAHEAIGRKAIKAAGRNSHPMRPRRPWAWIGTTTCSSPFLVMVISRITSARGMSYLLLRCNNIWDNATKFVRTHTSTVEGTFVPCDALAPDIKITLRNRRSPRKIIIKIAPLLA